MESNLFFYSKYRPNILDDFLCDIKVSQTSKLYDNVTLITGESGNGKTTLARILAKGYGSFTEFDSTNLIEEIAVCDSDSIIIDECNFFTGEQQSSLSRVIRRLSRSDKHIFICVDNKELLYCSILDTCGKIITVSKPSSNVVLPKLRQICVKENISCSDKELRDIVISSETMREIMIELNKLVCLRRSDLIG